MSIRKKKLCTGVERNMKKIQTDQEFLTRPRLAHWDAVLGAQMKYFEPYKMYGKKNSFSATTECTQCANRLLKVAQRRTKSNCKR